MHVVSQPPRSTSHLVKIVFLGIATGAVAWTPLVLFEGTPPQVLPVKNLPAAREAMASAGANLTKSASDLASGGLPPSSPFQSDNGALEPIVNAGLNEHLSDEPMRPDLVARESRPPETNDCRGETEPQLPAGPATDVRLGEEGQLPPTNVVASLVQLRQPERVAVANFESPVAGSSSASDDEAGTVRLMHDLGDANPSTAESALVELKARGFTDTHLQMARQLTSPDKAQRARLAAAIPGVAGIDARLWLTWLLRDEAAEVRVAALSVLATTGDPDSLWRVLEIARQDPEPQVRKLVEQIGRSRRVAH